MYEIPFDVFNKMVYSHLNSLHAPLSEFSSWTPSPLLVLSQGKDRAHQRGDPHEVNISIMITSCFEDKDIYHVPDILKVGLSQSESDEYMFPHEYLVHGPVNGRGFVTVPLPVYSENLGPVWDNLDEMSNWTESPIASFKRKAAGPAEQELEGCEEVAGLIVEMFATHQLDTKFLELWLIVSFFCMRGRSWLNKHTKSFDAIFKKLLATRSMETFLVEYALHKPPMRETAVQLLKHAPYLKDVLQAVRVMGMLVPMWKNLPLGDAVKMEIDEEEITADGERRILKFFDEELTPEEEKACMDNYIGWWTIQWWKE